MKKIAVIGMVGTSGASLIAAQTSKLEDLKDEFNTDKVYEITRNAPLEMDSMPLTRRQRRKIERDKKKSSK